tara:strand:+ start:199 stop:1644 length:1446 start_codon:yes stop_codon:yes gene_type:complete
MVTTSPDVKLMAHLLRRAGFGATREQLDQYISIGYEKVVDSLIDTEDSSRINDALVRRYFPDQSVTHDTTGAGSYWLYRLVSTDSPLREKIALFWHNVFATGYTKVTNGKPMSDQLRMFRSHGLAKLDDLLLKLSRDPAMIIWLDNVDNHNGAINENYGRELLELFSMGVGNYSEDDIKECSRAFTGWSIANSDYIKQLAVRNSIMPYGKLAWRYEYKEDDHDNGEKTFLGHKGNFNGEEIVKIICEQPATARFISRHLYHFFVADEPPVPSWPYKEPQDLKAISILEKTYFDSRYDIGEMIRVLLNSEFFKSETCHYKKIKSPAELAGNVLRTTEEFGTPNIRISERNSQITFMGQQLLNPPSVEGWHQGLEWIETGSLTERVNFASQHLGDLSKPGVRRIVQNVIDDEGESISAEICVDKCLDQLGAIQTSEYIYNTLVEFAQENGIPSINLLKNKEKAAKKISELISVIASVPEFQQS